MKICQRCGVAQPLDAFARRGDRPCGRRSVCLGCDRAYQRQRYAANRDAILARQRAQRAASRR